MCKRFIAAVVLVLVLACVAPVYASSGKDILRGVLGNVINEAVKS